MTNARPVNLDGSSDKSTGERPTLYHGLWVIFGRLANVLGVLVVSVAAARLLSRQDFGTFAVLMTVTHFWSLVSTFGLDQLALREIGRSKAEGYPLRIQQFARRSGILLVVAQTVCFVGCWLFCRIFSREIIGNESGPALLTCLASLACLRGLLQTAGEIGRALEDPVTANILGGHNGGPVSLGLFVAAAVTLGIAGLSGLFTFILAYSIAVCISLSLAILRLRRLLRIQNITSTMSVESRDGAHYLTEILTLLAISITTFSATKIDIVLAASFVGASEAALYEAASKLTVLIGFPLIISNLMIVSRVAGLSAKGHLKELEGMLQIASTGAAIPAAILSLVLFVFPEWCVRMVYGTGYAASSCSLRILIPGQLLFVFSGACGISLVQSGYTRIVFLTVLISAIAGILLSIRLAPGYGIAGIATGASASLGLANVLQLLATRKLVGIWTHCHPGLVTKLLPGNRRSLS